jgi:predicted transcriptional regulator of viral defense system
MKFEELLKRVADLPYFTTRFLSAGQNLAQVRLQLDRWVKGGRVVRLNKGLYVLAGPYRKVEPEKFALANKQKSHSYVSLQSALSWYGMIPEFVAVITSVTVGRTEAVENSLGRFEYRHISHNFFWGYQSLEFPAGRQDAFIARPEKALLDLVYLTAGGDRMEFLVGLRLQNFSRLNNGILDEYAEKSGSHKLKRAALNIKKIIDETQEIEL